jgi:hypothetical protein
LAKSIARWTPEQMKSFKALPPSMLATLKNPQTPQHLELALNIIHSLGAAGHAALPLLTELTKSYNDSTRMSAANAIGVMARHDDDALKLIVELATHPEAPYRETLVTGMRQAGARVLTLQDLIKERSAALPPKARNEIEFALQALTRGSDNPRPVNPGGEKKRYDIGNWY